MIDPSFDTLSAPSDMTEQYKAKIQDLLDISEDYKTKIADLEKQLKSATDNWEYARDRLQSRDRQVAELEDFLKSNHSDMDSEHVEEIAGIFGISLEKDYDVTITVTFSGTVSAPMDYDMDDLENDLQVSIGTNYYSDGSITVDVCEDSVDIDWTEA